MTIGFVKRIGLTLICAFMLNSILAATKSATVRINDQTKFQKITGFGGFVNSPQFGYNYMSTTEIRRLWGKSSEAGYNIMRMYIPIGEASWSQCLATAQLAKALGLKLFASPWSMPAEWKTNNNIAAVYTDANNVVQEGSLKEEYYDDYATYLNNFVTYLRSNGVELDAISIQNEPDMKATYAGCLWTPEQIAKFLKYYAKTINCKIIAPESVGITDNYASALLPDSVLAEYDIFAGHQYSYIQSGLKNIQAKGKEVWMTEYLINWNADENTTRNVSWAKDAFTFAEKLNEAMLANVNAWVHYAAKRFYGLMGDGTMGTVTGNMTKRGYIQSHYAKYATGTTRIDQTWMDDSKVLDGSTYLSVSGDSVILMVMNSSSDSYTLTIDLPFYTLSGTKISTTELLNLSSSAITLSEETFRPKVTVGASSFNTLIFKKSSVRPASKMVGQALHPNKIENLTVSNVAFGTTYKMSGKMVVFDHSNNLISANTTGASGYLRLDDTYNQLVFHIESVSSTMNYTSATTTLYYVNSLGTVSSYNYGTVSFDKNGNYDWVLDISRKVLTDGCIGVLGISNSNFSSILTIKFGEVFFRLGTEKLYSFTGVYSKGDSNLLDCMDDSTYTSLNFIGTDSITADLDFRAMAANKNAVFYTAASVDNSRANMVTGSTCSLLTLAESAGNFYLPSMFSATSATFDKMLNGYSMLVLPFQAVLPEGVKAYTLLASASNVTCTQISNNQIPANTPVLVEGTGSFQFKGSGTVSTPRALKVSNFYGLYIASFAPASSYVLKTVNGTTSFVKVTLGAEPSMPPFSSYLFFPSSVAASSLPLNIIPMGIKSVKTDVMDLDLPFYDLSGRLVENPRRGIFIQKGKKIVFN
jgi:glucuronoarabinoxylan endo-1,4-beta-xylanase